MTSHPIRKLFAVVFSVLLAASVLNGAAFVGVSTAQTDVLYRANAGGGFTASDGGPDWQPASDFLVAGGQSTASHGQPSTIDESVPAGTPTQIWETERWDDSGGDEMQYEFAVPEGQQVEVRLYFYDGYSGTSSVGDRVFDVTIEGQTVLDDFDIIETYGDDTGAMESFVVTSDGTIDVDFGHVVENPQVNAIEIVSTTSSPGELGASPSSVDFGTVVNGSTQTETVTLTNLGNASNSSHPDISVDGVSIDGATPSKFAHDFSGSVTLAPGESTTVNVTYAPGEVGTHSATMNVSHNGTNSPVSVGLAGEGVSALDPDFSKSTLQGFSAGNPTALEFGPDGRLYVATQGGTVYALEVERTGQDSYQVTNQVQIDAIKDIPNHLDNGDYDPGDGDRQITGLATAGTASTPVVYVSSSDSEIDVKEIDNDTDTNSGAISRLTFDWNTDGSLASLDHDVMVTGLPRSSENHATNGIDVSADGDTLYVAQGGHTNKGAPDDNFGFVPEYALSGAILEIDLAQIEANHAPKNFQNYNPQGSTQSYPDLTFYYAIPTIDTDDSTDGDDLPFGGERGANMAKLVEGGPVQIYSPGYRNPYDLVMTESGQLYAADHGPNGGWGGQPVDATGTITASASDVTNLPNEQGSFSTNDQLIKVDAGDYGGHAAPIRANPTGADIYDENGTLVLDITSSNTPVPASLVDPRQADYIPPSDPGSNPDPGAPWGSANTMENENGDKVLFAPTGATDEYTASNFDGAMQGDLLQVELYGSIWRVELGGNGENATKVESWNTNGPLGLDAVGDDGPFPGTFWTANHGGNDITVFEPVDYDGTGGGDTCEGTDDPALDEDGDGYDNADEIDAGSDPCSSASTPPDFDGDFTSNLNDDDDDNDGIVDTEDVFAVDATNGVDTSLPVSHDLAELSLFTDDGQGWTGVMMNGSDYQDLYDTSQMTIGGAAEALTVEGVPQGDAHEATNTQAYAFQFGVNASEPFVVNTTVNGLPADAEPYQSQGLFIGTGDQDNYAKLTVTGFSSGGGSGVQLATEEAGSFTGVANPAAPTAGNTTDLSMVVYPSNGTVEAYYAVGGGTMQFVGQTTVPTSWFDTADGNGTAVGIISTSNGATSTFDATWTDISVEQLNPPANQPPAADAGADQTVDENVTVQLDGTGSSDPDGDQLGYTWVQTDGPSVSLSANDAQQPTFTAPDVASDTTLTFDLTVSDGLESDTDTVNVTVQDVAAATGDVVYRVNAGGAEVAATDGGPAWSADTDGAPSPYVNYDGDNGLNTYATGDTITLNDSVPTSTPASVFQSERYDVNTSGSATDDVEMQWAFPVDAGSTYEVRLYYAEIFLESTSDAQYPRVFDVLIEGAVAQDDYNIFDTYGHDVGAMESFQVTPADDTLNLTFLHEQENPKISAIEIVKVDDANAAPSIDPIPDQTVTEGDSVSVDVNASDPDGDALSLSLDGAPAFVSLADAGDGNGTLTIAPGSGDAGSYQFDVVADDGQATANETVGVTVEPGAETYGVETGSTSNVQINTSTLTNASATMNGTLTLGDKSEATPYVKIWPQEQPEDAFWYTGAPMTASGEFEFDVVLSPSTTYVWQTLSKSADGDWRTGEQKTFTTPTGQYFGVTTNAPSAVGVEWVTLEGEIVNLGDNDNATVYFTYWEQGQKASTLTWYTGPVQSTTGPFSTQVQLDPNTTYEYRAFGQSDEGEWKAGPVVSFTTQDGQPYGVATEPATNVGADSATLNGNLTGLGDYDNATVYFQYWVQGQKGATLEWWTGSPQSSPGPFSATVGLQDNTTYEFQAYAQSDEGKWTAGSMETLTTDETSDTASVTITSPTEGETITGDSITVSWDGTAATSSDHVHVQLDDEPYVGLQPIDGSYTFENVAPGDHTITAEVADSNHNVYENSGDQVNVTLEAPQTGSVQVAITPNSGIGASTYNGGSFQVTNTGEKNVTTVVIDLDSTSLPDMVFDPDGTAGDQAAKGLSIDGESGDGVGVVSTDDADVFSEPHNGVNGSDGYDVLTIQFTDFEPGETVTFSADNDPTSIKGATVSSQEAGPVSGLELARATVTVGYEDSTTQTSQTIGDGSQGGAEAFLDDSVPAAPGIDVVGVSLDATTLDSQHSAAVVTNASQTVTVSGPAGANVTLVQVEGELELEYVPTYDGTPGYEIEDFEANKAENVVYYTDTIGSDGTVDVPVTLTNSTTKGGFNYLVANVEDADGAGMGSNVVVLQYTPDGDTGTVDQPVYAVNAGGGAYSAVDGTEYAADAYFDQFQGTASTGLAIGNTEDDTLYQTERYGSPLSYSFPVANDTYNVTLQFAEIWHTSETGGAGDDSGDGDGEVGDRVFDVSIEGQQVLTDYDIYAAVGGLNATQKTFTVPVTDGTLDVSMVASEDYAKVSAIVVENATTDGGDSNTAPTVDAISDQTVVSGENVDVSVSATDDDGDALTLSKTAGPSFVSLVDDGDGTGVLVVEPSSVDAGTYTVEVTADDGTDQTSESFQLTVDTATAVTSGDVAYRVDAGNGTTTNAVDSGPDWVGVTGTGSPLLVTHGGNTYCGGDAVSLTGAVPSSTPAAVYDCELYGPMAWEFATDPGQEVEVRLYLSNQFSGASAEGDRQYNVSVEGQQVLTEYDPVADVGHANGTVKAFTVTDDGDGTVTVSFEAGAVENPQVNAIEVVNLSSGGTSTASSAFAVNENGGIEASTYNAGSFEVTNTGDTQITSVTYDLGTAALPDIVFDPDGTAGDAGAKCLEPSSGASQTGYVTPSDPCTDPFSSPHNGVNSSDGYDELTAEFTDFDPGETFSFAVDIDPTSIKGGTSTGSAGSVSGLELSGATVTVTYADGSTQTTDLFGDGSDGGAQADATDSVATAPSIDVDGVTLDTGILDDRHSGATVTSATQTINVTGPADATVQLLRIEGQRELDAASGYELEAYEANTAEVVEYQSVSLGSDGQATVTVTLTNSSTSDVEGGYNYLLATVSDADGTGDTSNVVVLKLDAN